ncbi:DUF4190 domain-containing protein [Streptomyces sp. NPDC050534]|uniref:DUF4190 domain-containing protein n=1 Tax=Streptomyces sp. NPDC050534 TaxID=3365625 RepID=UPI0037BB9A78
MSEAGARCPCPYPRRLDPTSPRSPKGRTRRARSRRIRRAPTALPDRIRTSPGARAAARSAGRAPVNGVAIASLVLGILCFVPAVGLVLGVIALAQIRKRGGQGKGMAVAGSVLSTVGLALWALALAGGVHFSTWSGVKNAAGDHGSAYSLTEGDCFDAPSRSLEGTAYDVDKVLCEKQHDGEVFAVFRMTGGSAYPGDGKVTDIADARCYGLRYGYAMDAWAVPDYVDVYYMTPTRDSWGFGDREVTCLFGNTDETAGLTGSLRNDERSLSDDQVAYLKAVDVENAALDRQPVDSPDDDLQGSREWAGQMSAALARETRLLRAHAWPAGAGKPVAEVAAKVAAGRKEWALAAKAADADSFYAHYDRAMVLADPDTSVTARKALGLATTPPVAGEGSGGRDDGGDGSGLDV